jgi:hypothetical protein
MGRKRVELVDAERRVGCGRRLISGRCLWLLQAYGSVISTVGGAKGWDAIKRARAAYAHFSESPLPPDPYVVSAMISGPWAGWKFLARRIWRCTRNPRISFFWCECLLFEILSLFYFGWLLSTVATAVTCSVRPMYSYVLQCKFF